LGSILADRRHRRIPTIEQLTAEVRALVQERQANRITIDGQFSLTAARTTMNRHYTKVLPANQQYLVT